MSLLSRLKEQNPDMKFQIIVPAITHCKYCGRQACPEVTRILPTQPRSDEFLSNVTPTTPPALLACCSECGEFMAVI